MSNRVGPIIETIFGILTVTSTVFFSDLLTQLVIGVIVYFMSRFLYRTYGDCVYRKIQRLKDRFRKKK